MSDLFTTYEAPEAPADLAESIRSMRDLLDVWPSHAVPPGIMLLVSPPDFRSLFAPMAPPKWDAEPSPFGLTDLRVRFSRPEPLFPRHMVMASVVDCGPPTRYELRLGPYQDVAEPWCVVKNLDTERREVHDWPLPRYVSENLVAGPGPPIPFTEAEARAAVTRG